MNTTSDLTKTTAAIGHLTSLIFGLPFDAIRASYAKAVRFGLLENSLLKSARFERELAKVERLTLGPWSRRV
ncbi:MAG: hypothetical protein ACOYNF_13175 [Rhodoferax sp.]